MSTVWIVSLALAWVVIALLTACVLTLLRQVGELRVAAGANAAGPQPATGPRLYDAVEPVELPLLGERRRSLALGGDGRPPALLVVHAPGCPNCAAIEDVLEQVARDRPGVRVVSVIALARRAAREHALTGGAGEVPCVAVEDVPAALVPDALPALVAIAREGVVAAVGAPESGRDLREAADVAAGAVLIAGPDSLRETDWGYAVPAWDADDPVALDVMQVLPDDDSKRGE